MNFPPMKALEFITGHVIFKLRYNQIYQMKTTLMYLTWFKFFQFKKNLKKNTWDSTKLLTFRNAFWCKLPLMYSGDFRPNRHRWISRLFCSYSHHSPRIVLLFRRINASQLKNDTKNINHSFILIPYTSYKQILIAMGWNCLWRKEEFFFIHLRIFMINLYYTYV